VGMTSVVLIEDGLTMATDLFHQLRSLIGPSGQRVRLLETFDHDRALRWGRWPEADVVLLDAYFSDRQRRDPSASMFAGLEVAERLSTCQPMPKVIGYSGLARRPEVNIPFREPGSVVALFDLVGLVDNLGSAIWDTVPVGKLKEPVPADYEALGVSPNARIAEALSLMRQRPERWEVIAGIEKNRNPPPKVREFVNDRIRPLLGIEEPYYRLAIEVLRRVTRLPAR
jgi:hypothetical protein